MMFIVAYLLVIMATQLALAVDCVTQRGLLFQQTSKLLFETYKTNSVCPCRRDFELNHLPKCNISDIVYKLKNVENAILNATRKFEAEILPSDSQCIQNGDRTESIQYSDLADAFLQSYKILTTAALKSSLVRQHIHSIRHDIPLELIEDLLCHMKATLLGTDMERHLFHHRVDIDRGLSTTDMIIFACHELLQSYQLVTKVKRIIQNFI